MNVYFYFSQGEEPVLLFWQKYFLYASIHAFT